MQDPAFYEASSIPLWSTCLQGQTVNFPVNRSEVCSSLPKTLDNVGIVLIAPSRTGGSDTTEVPDPQNYFTIQCPYVVRALHCLRDNNALNRDFKIKEVSDDTPSTQTAANEIALDAEGELSFSRRNLQVPNVEISSIITNNNAPMHQLQHVQGAPSAYTHYTNAVQMAFQWLYPDGTNGYKTSRDPPITTLDYFQSCCLIVTHAGQVTFHTCFEVPMYLSSIG